jgi:methyl-accepting chemotaxis protein
MLAVHPIEGGVLASDVRLTHLQEVLEDIEVIENSVGMIVDQNGMVLASTTDAAKIQDNVNDLSEFSAFSQKMLNNKNLVGEIKLEGMDNLLVSTRIELEGSKPWYLMIAVNEKAAFASVYEASWQLLILAVTITLFFVLILIVVLNRIYHPVIALKELVANLSNGDGDLTQRLTVSTKDDLGQIATGVNSFIESLQLMMLDVKRVSGRLSEGGRY